MNAQNRHRSNRIFLCALCGIVLAIVVLLNLIMKKVPVRWSEFDISANRLYTLSQQTLDVLDALEQPVCLNLIASGGSEDEQLVRLLEKYSRRNHYITIAYIDPVLMPTFVSTYTSNRLSDNSIIVTTEDARFRLLRNADLYPSTYNSDTGAKSTAFDAEGQITSAIHYLAEADMIEMFAITGHGEEAFSYTLQAALYKEGIACADLNLVTISEIASDTDCLIWNVPISDISSEEETKLRAYLERGGRLMLITSYTATNTPNLDRLLSGYGMQAEKGLIIEADSDYYVPTYPSMLLPSVLETEITAPILEEDMLVLLPNAHAIVEASDVRSSVTRTPLLKTSASAYLKEPTADTYSQEADDRTGPFCTAMAVSEQTAYAQTRIVWISSSSFLTENIDSMVSGSNSDLFLNALAWMTQQESSITIRPKQQSTSPVRLTSSQAMVWSIVFVLLLPVAVVAAGIVVYVRRKRRV